MEGESNQFWEVLDDPHFSTQLIGVSELPKTVENLKCNNSKLLLDIEVTLTVVALPRDLEDEEELEDHYKVMLLEDQMGETTEIIDFEESLEIDLDSDVTANAISHELSNRINVPSPNLLSVADRILCDALANARDISLVHMKAFIKVEVVEESDDDDVGATDVEPVFVPASRSSIEKLERVRVEATSSPGASCSICIGEIAVGSEAIRMPCSHLYHEGCIVEWLERSRFCPLCRFTIAADMEM